ncbi:MAG: hypothetical protein RL536_65 [Candidatus Parcubacteria bacterium]
MNKSITVLFASEKTLSAKACEALSDMVLNMLQLHSKDAAANLEELGMYVNISTEFQVYTVGSVTGTLFVALVQTKDWTSDVIIIAKPQTPKGQPSFTCNKITFDDLLQKAANN